MTILQRGRSAGAERHRRSTSQHPCGQMWLVYEKDYGLRFGAFCQATRTDSGGGKGVLSGRFCRAAGCRPLRQARCLRLRSRPGHPTKFRRHRVNVISLGLLRFAEIFSGDRAIRGSATKRTGSWPLGRAERRRFRRARRICCRNASSR